MQESNVTLAIRLLGGAADVARRAGLKTAWGVSKWREALPADRVLWLSEETGWRFSPHELAPERYPHPDDGLPEELRGLSADERRDRAQPIAMLIPENFAESAPQQAAYAGDDRRRQLG